MSEINSDDMFRRTRITHFSEELQKRFTENLSSFRGVEVDYVDGHAPTMGEKLLAWFRGKEAKEIKGHYIVQVTVDGIEYLADLFTGNSVQSNVEAYTRRNCVVKVIEI